MNRTGGRSLDSMRPVEIQEFSLSTEIEYRHAVMFGDARLERVAKALTLPPCGDYLNPAEIKLNRENEWFSYDLTAPLFRGAGVVRINASGIRLSFTQGRTKAHLDLMKALTLAILREAKAGEVGRSLLAFTAHAIFQSPADFNFTEHMKRYTALSPAVLSGGTVLVLGIPQIHGEFRYASEKSLTHEHGIFMAANATVECDVTEGLFTTLEEQLRAVAGLDGIRLSQG